MNPNNPLVAIVGLPNAGKSTLLNKIAHDQVAVTSPVAGTTRDRQYLDTTWGGSNFTLVDTAGLSLDPKGELETNVEQQIDIAVHEADVIIWVIDGKDPADSIPQQLVRRFRKLGKPLILAINKLDSPKNLEEKISAYAHLGIKSLFPVSSVTGRGIGDLLDSIVSLLPVSALTTNDSRLTTSIAVAIVGKPNVGKSSIFNKILGNDRVVVSSVPGTTRTAIDSQIKIGKTDYVFIDTAGLKKRQSQSARPDLYSGFQTFKSIRRSDVCFFVIDAAKEITKQDQAVAHEIFELDKGCIILANKMDTYEGNEENLRDYISHHFPFLWMSPLFFVSAVTGSGLEIALANIKPIYERRRKIVPQEDLDAVLAKAIQHNPPKLLRDERAPKVFGLKQLATDPPLFELLINRPSAISMQFRKYLHNLIIKDLDFYGTPINIKMRAKLAK